PEARPPERPRLGIVFERLEMLGADGDERAPRIGGQAPCKSLGEIAERGVDGDGAVGPPRRQGEWVGVRQLWGVAWHSRRRARLAAGGRGAGGGGGRGACAARVLAGVGPGGGDGGRAPGRDFWPPARGRGSSALRPRPRGAAGPGARSRWACRRAWWDRRG